MAATTRESRVANRENVKNAQQSATKPSPAKVSSQSKSKKESKAGSDNMVKKMEHMEQAHEKADPERRREIEESFQMREARQTTEPEEMNLESEDLSAGSGPGYGSSAGASADNTSDNSGYALSSDLDVLPPQVRKLCSDDDVIPRGTPATLYGHFRGPGGWLWGVTRQGPDGSHRYGIKCPNDCKTEGKVDVLNNELPCDIKRMVGAAIYAAKGSKKTVLELLGHNERAPLTRVLILGTNGKVYVVDRTQVRKKWPGGNSYEEAPENLVVDGKVVVQKGSSMRVADFAISQRIARAEEAYRLWSENKRDGRERTPHSPTPEPEVMRRSPELGDGVGG